MITNQATLEKENQQAKTTFSQGDQLLNDEKELITVYRRAKRLGYADIMISIQEGRRVKLWLTEKINFTISR